MEVCRIAIVLRASGVVDVGAPMKYKPLCYDILRDARKVIERTADWHFIARQVSVPAQIIIVMDMSGVVDVSAPLPNRELCYRMLEDAKVVIERYDDAEAPAKRPFDSVMLEN